jgi:hypothetical protein
MIRVINHPNLSRTFKKHEDAKRWGNETELKIRREDAGIVKIKFPPFKDISLRYLNEVSIHKKCHRDERYTINSLNNEAWSEYPINKITPLIIGRYRDKQREVVKDNTINRKLDVVSTIYTTCKKEAWAEKIAKKPRPKPTYINGNVIDLHPFIHDPWWLIHEEKPEDEDTSIQTPEGIIRAFVQKPRTDKGVASLFRLKKFS